VNVHQMITTITTPKDVGDKMLCLQYLMLNYQN